METEERRTFDQKRLDNLHDGSQCKKVGQASIKLAKLRHTKTLHAWMAAKKKITPILTKEVTISSKKLSEIKPGQCGFVFSDRSYLSVKAQYDRAKKVEILWRGRVSESRQLVAKYVHIASRMVKRCYCVTKEDRDTLWSALTEKTRLALQSQTHAKCKMMQCVLKGIKFNSPVCQSHLKTLINKKLIKAVEQEKCLHGKAEKKEKAFKVAKRKRKRAAAAAIAKEKDAKRLQAAEEKIAKESTKRKAAEKAVKAEKTRKLPKKKAAQEAKKKKAAEKVAKKKAAAKKKASEKDAKKKRNLKRKKTDEAKTKAKKAKKNLKAKKSTAKAKKAKAQTKKKEATKAKAKAKKLKTKAEQAKAKAKKLKTKAKTKLLSVGNKKAKKAVNKTAEKANKKATLMVKKTMEKAQKQIVTAAKAKASTKKGP